MERRRGRARARLGGALWVKGSARALPASSPHVSAEFLHQQHGRCLRGEPGRRRLCSPRVPGPLPPPARGPVGEVSADVAAPAQAGAGPHSRGGPGRGCRVGPEARATRCQGAGGLSGLGREGRAAWPSRPGLAAGSDLASARQSVRPRPRLPAVTQGPATLPRPAQTGLLREHLSEGSRCPAGVAARGSGCLVGVRRGPDHPRGRRNPLDSVARGWRPALMGRGRVPGPPPRPRLASVRLGPEFFIHLFRPPFRANWEPATCGG